MPDKFELPAKTDWMKSQMLHEPSREYSEEIFELIKGYPYEHALEIGCAWGLSTLAILLAQPSGLLTSVDKDETVKSPAEVEVNGLNDRWRLRIMPSADFWRTDPEGMKGKYDIVYIDGSHMYDDVFNDLFNAWDFCRPGGLIFLDDVTHKDNGLADITNGKSMYGVSLAAWQLKFGKNINEIGNSYRLIWFKKHL